MRLKLYFGKSDTVFKNDLYDHTLSFLHKCLGENNKYHNAFSQYSISTPLGYKVKGDGVIFPNGGTMYVNSNDVNFINDLIKGILNQQKLSIGDMPYCGMEMFEYDVHSDYDLVRTLTPIVLRRKADRKYLTYKDGTDFFSILEEQCKKKLIHLGYEKDAESLKLIPFHLENSKVKYVKFKKGCFPASQMMFIVQGTKTARKNLYELGFGSITGSGFGNIEINKR